MFIGEEEEKLISSHIILDYFKYKDRFRLYKYFVEAKLKNQELNEVE
ncbi:hypothetical protein [Clostridium gasigenes]|nr:hypothetical protein [Clostridium gasigenes]